MRNHYEVLNLEKNCSSKDIKDAFIKLSKQYHPDKNKNPEAHKKFVEVNEAYSVLGKSYSRLNYDQTLSAQNRQSRVTYQRSTRAASPSQEQQFYANAQNFKHNYEKTGNFNPYLKYKTVLYCCLLMAIGTGIRLIVLWKEIQRKTNQSQEISIILKEVRERAHKLGKEQAIIEMQKAMLKKRVESPKNRPDQ